MKLIKRIIIGIVHKMGFDIIRRDYSLGLTKYPVRTVIDIGANEGLFSQKIEKLFPEAHIYCFEPLPGPLKKLKEWVKDKTDKVTIFEFAVGDKEEEKNMLFCPSKNPSSSFLKNTSVSEELYLGTAKQVPVKVKIKTLDEVMEKISLSSDILIKMDVTGYEDKVILGGKNVFLRSKICILAISFSLMRENQPNFKNIYSIMDELGFEYAGNWAQHCAKDGSVIFINAVFLKREL